MKIKESLYQLFSKLGLMKSAHNRTMQESSPNIPDWETEGGSVELPPSQRHQDEHCN